MKQLDLVFGIFNLMQTLLPVSLVSKTMIEYKVTIEVKRVKDYCASGHKQGNKFEIDGEKSLRGLCISAIVVLYPSILSMRFGVELSRLMEDRTYALCPDYKNQVLFELIKKRKD
jgi:uncharacterized repeat protein (TIGR04076 family)